MAELNLNGEVVAVDDDPGMPLLWALRDRLGLTGTKFGCGVGLCGACTVHVDGFAVRSCITPIGGLEGVEITTIEAMPEDELGAAVQAAWIEQQVPQCGYCQPGMIMAATALLAETPAPTDDDIDAAITNICRCGTYPRIRTAIKRAAQLRAAESARAGLPDTEASDG
ncbi:MAG: (2Fe-2S)-binding protein [Pseudomonadota bacterium]